MSPIVILIIGMITVLASILVLRLHPVLELPGELLAKLFPMI